MKGSVIGVVFLVSGSYFLWNVIRHPRKGKGDPLTTNFRMYLGSILLIVIGILSLCGWMKW